jgi:hypothetical protein
VSYVRVSSKEQGRAAYDLPQPGRAAACRIRFPRASPRVRRFFSR